MEVATVIVTVTGSKHHGGREHELEAGRPLRIGRADDNDVVCNEPWVSHRHCEILLENFGMCTLKVLSTNGASLVRGGQVHVVKAHHTSELMEGDYVMLKGPSRARREMRIHISFGGGIETKSSIVWKLLQVMDRIRLLERENTQMECKLQRNGAWETSAETAASLDESTVEALEKRKAELEQNIIKRKTFWELELHAMHQELQKNELIEQNKKIRSTCDRLEYEKRLAEEDLDPTKRLEDGHPAKRLKPLAYDEILQMEERTMCEALATPRSSGNPLI